MIEWFFKRFMPHAHCFLKEDMAIAMHIYSDLIIFLAYCVIPLLLVLILRKRNDVRMRWMVVSFALFIIFCGFTHLLAVIDMYRGYYYLSGVVKVLTGIASISTSIALWIVYPRLIILPTIKEFQRIKAINIRLQEKIDILIEPSE